MKRLVLTIWLFWPGPTHAQDVQYYHLDAIGNVRAVTDQSGAVVERHDYLPFGEECITGACASNPGIAGGQPRHFTGKERDAETGLDYFGARYFRAVAGRFTTVDPVYTARENLVDPQRWNRYAYAKNNPLRYIDPDGRLTIIIPGTNYRNSAWNERMGLFALAQSTFGEKPQLLYWTGGNTDAARRAAAAQLQEMIAHHSFGHNEKLNIVAHSHGGNAAFIASATVSRRIDTLVTLGTPIRSDYTPVKGHIDNFVNVYSETDKIQVNGGFGGFFCLGQGECGPAGRQSPWADKNLNSGVRDGPIDSHSLLWQDPRVWSRVVAPALRK